MRVKALFLFTLAFVTHSLWASPQQPIPEFCQRHFPVIDQAAVSSRVVVDENNPNACMMTHTGLEVSVPSRTLLQFYGEIQDAQYRESATKFRAAVREKVLRALVRSQNIYDGLFDRQTCENFPDNRRGRRDRRACERQYDVTPQCNDPAMQALIEAEQDAHQQGRRARELDFLREAVTAQGGEFNEEGLTPTDFQGARGVISEANKRGFTRNNVEAALRAHILQEKKKQIVHAHNQAMIDHSNNFPQPDFSRVNDNFRERTLAYFEREEQLLSSHERALEEIQVHLGIIYERHPTALNIEHSTSWLLFSNSDYEVSPYGKTLLERVLPNVEGLDFSKSLSELEALVESEQVQAAIQTTAQAFTENPDLQAEEQGRDEVIAELKQKKEAIERICNEDPQDLHHFEALAYEVLQDQQGNPEELVEHQAGYCYLIQREPLRDGGFSTGALLLGGVALVGGAALQFIPGLGTFAGAGAIAWGATLIGGGIFTADAIDRYTTARDQHASTQTVYHGAYEWVGAEDLRASADNFRTQRNFAIAEVALATVDVTGAVRAGVRAGTVARRTGDALEAAGRVRDAAPPARVVVPDEIIPPSPVVDEVAPTAVTVIDEVPRSPSVPALRAPDEALPPSIPDEVIRPVAVVDEAPRAPPVPAVIDDVPVLSATPVDEVIPPAAITQESVPALPPPDDVIEGTVLSSRTEVVPPPRPSPVGLSVEDQAFLREFQALPPHVRASRVNDIQRKIATTGEVEQAEFFALVMQRGGYNGVFTDGPQQMALDLMNQLGNEEEALRVLRQFFAGKDSARSQQRLIDLENMVADLHRAQRPALEGPQRAVTVVEPVAPRDVATPVEPSTAVVARTGTELEPVAPRDVATPVEPSTALVARAGTEVEPVAAREVASPVEPGTALTVPTPTEVGPVSTPGLRLTDEPSLGLRPPRADEATTPSLRDLYLSPIFTSARRSLMGFLGWDTDDEEDEVIDEPVPPVQDDETTPTDGDDETPVACVEPGGTYAAGSGRTCCGPGVIGMHPDAELGIGGVRICKYIYYIRVEREDSEDGRTTKLIASIERGGHERELTGTTFQWVVVKNNNTGDEFAEPSDDEIVELSETGTEVVVPRESANYQVLVRARDVSNDIQVYPTAVQINARTVEEQEPSPDSEPEDEEEEPADDPAPVDTEVNWTLEISHELIPDTAKAKVKLKATKVGDIDLPSDMRMSLEVVVSREGETAPSMPSSKTGTEVEFEVPLKNFAYSIQGVSQSGDKTVRTQDHVIDKCEESSGSRCSEATEDAAQENTEPPLPPANPPPRFTPSPVPQPQMYIIPGFF